MTHQRGYTALLRAARHGHAKIATLLLDMGASSDYARKVSYFACMDHVVDINIEIVLDDEISILYFLRRTYVHPSVLPPPSLLTFLPPSVSPCLFSWHPRINVCISNQQSDTLSCIRMVTMHSYGLCSKAILRW